MIEAVLALFEDKAQSDELGKFYKQYKNRFFGIAYSKLHNREEVEDVIQEAFLRISDNPDKFFEMTNEERVRFVDGIVRHISIDEFNRRNKNSAVSIDEVGENIISNSISPEEKYIAGCAVIIYSLGGFRTDVNADNTQLFPIGLEECPQSIEEVYYLSELPDGFELQEESTSDISIYKKYLNSTTGQIITLHQSIKKAFEPHYNTEISDLEEIQINEYTGILLCGKENYIIAWDNGDYILQLSTNISKEKTIYLAKNAKISGK